MEIFCKKSKKNSEIQLTKSKMGLNIRKMTNHPPSPINDDITTNNTTTTTTNNNNNNGNPNNVTPDHMMSKCKCRLPAL